MVIATPKVEDARVGHRTDFKVTHWSRCVEAVSPLGRPNPGRKEMPVLHQPGRFTNTAVHKFDGTVCWQQHLQVFKAIAKSNSSSATWRGGGLNVALLMPEGERPPERAVAKLAVFRRRYDSREGEDPSAFATELDIFEVSGALVHRPEPEWSGTGSFRNNKVVD